MYATYCNRVQASAPVQQDKNTDRRAVAASEAAKFPSSNVVAKLRALERRNFVLLWPGCEGEKAELLQRTSPKVIPKRPRAAVNGLFKDGWRGVRFKFVPLRMQTRGLSVYVWLCVS